jgi:hypothetical protein
MLDLDLLVDEIIQTCTNNDRSEFRRPKNIWILIHYTA